MERQAKIQEVGESEAKEQEGQEQARQAITACAGGLRPTKARVPLVYNFTFCH